MLMNERALPPKRAGETFATAYIRYEMSPHLAEAATLLYSHRQNREDIELRSLSSRLVSLRPGGSIEDFTPESQDWIDQQRASLAHIDATEKIPLSSHVEYIKDVTRGREKSSEIHGVLFNLVPQHQATAERLGELAVSCLPGERHVFSAGLFVPGPRVSTQASIDQIVHEFQGMLGMNHPSRAGRADKIAAPASLEWWVGQPTLRIQPRKPTVLRSNHP